MKVRFARAHAHPALMAVLAIILIVRTRGAYTRWLALNIIVCVLALTYVLGPNVFRELLCQGVRRVSTR